MNVQRCLGALALVAGAVASGCSSEPIFKNRPGKTFGEIYVGDVRVSSRERLVNDRLMQDTWLKSQLANSDSAEFGFQGATDQRSFSGTSARIEANLDQTQLNNYRAQQSTSADSLRRQNELADLDTQLQRQYKQRQLEYMQQQPATAFAYAPPSSASSSPQAVTPPTGPTASDDLRKLKEDIGKFTIPPNQLVLPEKLKPSPQDIFRDKLELRGLIRNEMIKNALDDRHDLRGHTLLRFDLDATVRPHEDTSAWAVIEVELDREAMKSQCDVDLRDRWLKHVEREINENGLRIMRQVFVAGRLALIGQEAATVVRRTELFVAGMVSTLPDHILFEIQKDWMEKNKGKLPIPLQNVPHEIKNSPSVEGTQYATAGAIIISKGRGTRDPAIVPVEDYVRTLHAEILNAYTKFAGEVNIPHVTVAVETNANRVAVKAVDPASKSGLDYFCAHLLNSVNLYAYGTTPEESVQRIGEVASRRNFNEVMLALNFLAGNSAAGKAYFDMIKVNEGIFQALRRQPLAVGFNRNSAGGNARFGWLLGPRFGVRDDGTESQFRHTTALTPLSGVLSLPGWIDEINLKVTTYWVTETGKSDQGAETNPAGRGNAPALPFWLNAAGKQQLEHGPDFPGRTMAGPPKSVKVRLREDLTAITDALGRRPIRIPRVNYRQHLSFKEGSPAQVTIPGQNLWRNPTVILGGQQAEEVFVLPDMRGIVARFKEIRVPDSPEGKTESVPLIVWTSEGHANAGLVKIDQLKAATATPVATLASPAVIAGKDATIKLSVPQKSFYQMKVWVGASSGVAEEVLISGVVDGGAAAKVTVPLLKNAKSGEGAMLQVTVKDAPDNRLSAPYGGPVTGVYYASEDDTKAKMAPSALVLANLETPIVVTLPVKSSLIYPDSEGQIDIKITGKTGSPELTASACTLENGKDLKPGQCAFKLKPKDDFKADGEYTVSVSAKSTKIPVTPDTVKVTLKAPKPPEKKADDKKGDAPKKDGAKKDPGKRAEAKDETRKEETKKK